MLKQGDRFPSITLDFVDGGTVRFAHAVDSSGGKLDIPYAYTLSQGPDGMILFTLNLPEFKGHTCSESPQNHPRTRPRSIPPCTASWPRPHRARR